MPRALPLDPEAKPKRNYLLRRGWKDLLFLIALGFLLHWLYRLEHPLPASIADDIEHWHARPALNLTNVKTTSIPCLFVALSSDPPSPVPSGRVADCLALIPNGVPMDLVEVDISKGDFTPVKTDLFLPGKMSIAFTRTYSQADDWFKRNGSSIPHVYDLYLTGSRHPYTYQDWSFPDGRHTHFTRISGGTEFGDAVFRADDAAPRELGGAECAWDGWGWAFVIPDGTTFLSPEAYNAKRPQQGSLIAVFDKDGNEIRLSREENGDLREIMSPEGRSIRLDYTDGRLSGLQDSGGNRVSYEYDSALRPANVKYSSGAEIHYAFDDANFITAIESPPGRPILTVTYDSRHNVTALTLADGASYAIRYGYKLEGTFQTADITAPDASTMRVELQRSTYSVTTGPRKAH